MPQEGAWERAIKYLTIRPRTERQVRDYLINKRFDPLEIEDVMDRLKKAKYVDDRRFAEGFTRARSEHKLHGRYRLVRDLKTRGVEAERAKTIVEERFTSDFEKEQLEKAVEKWLRSHGAPKQRKDLNSLHNYLFRLGYEPALIFEKLRSFKLKDEEQRG